MAGTDGELASGESDLARYMGTPEAMGAAIWQLQTIALVRELAQRPLSDLEYTETLRQITPK